MSMRPNMGQQTVAAFFQAYLVERDWKKTETYLSGDILWIGTGKSEIVRGIHNAQEALADEIGKDPDAYELHDWKAYEVPVTEESTAVLCTLLVLRKEEKQHIELRVTAVCRMEGEECKIVSIHASAPLSDQEEGEYFPSRSSAPKDTEFEQRISRKSVDLLSRSVAGGIMGGYLEPGYPLYYVSERMLDFLGYTYEEFVKTIEGNIVNCIYPAEQKQVQEQVEKAFSCGDEYHATYRMVKKDGSYVWVEDIGKKGVADDGRSVCLSVIKDISKEMETTERLRKEIEERERQVDKYNHLFQSVLCGIVQYYLKDDDTVAFQDANREAIRIFGYTEEEFWRKENWNLTSLIAEEDRKIVEEGIASLINVGDTSGYEYRLVQRDGSYCWIVGIAEIIQDMDGNILIQSVFIDIDRRKRMELKNQVLAEQVEAGNELLKMALEHTSTCEFFYYPFQERCLMPPRTREYYHCRAVYKDMPYSFAEEMVGKPWRNEYISMCGRIKEGSGSESIEYKSDQGDTWCRITMSAVGNKEEGTFRYVVGLIEDITKEKEMELALEEERHKDHLTGLYTKEAGVEKIRRYLEEKEPAAVCCLMLLDMDNFGELNSEEGSVYADVILQEVGSLLLHEAENEGIPVRMGGDEFMLFLPGCDKSQAVQTGKRLAKKVEELSFIKNQKYRVSASIGMCSTSVVEEYSGLYRCAESTLQYVKQHSKGRAACYLDVSNEIGTMLTQIYEGEYLLNAIENQENYSGKDLVAFALELLGKAKKLDDAVALLLARVGKQYGLDRVSIAEANQEYLYLRLSYQWSRRREDAQRERIIYVEAADFNQMANSFDEEGLCDEWFWNKNRMPSILCSAIWNQGGFAGMMCLEAKEEGYPWTYEQREQLKELTKLITTFLMQAKADTVSKAKTDFLSRMSHEIRTPMNAIFGMTAIAKTVINDSERTMDCLNKIEGANQYLLELINDILDMSRIESGRMELNAENADLQQQAQRIWELLQPQAAAKHIELILDYRYPENAPVVVDVLRLNQVLINIIGNAVKFTGEGGRVTVLIEQKRLSEHEAELLFSVKDTGIGIRPEAIGQIFNAFEQADRSTASRYGGTGLGLSISYRLVQMMGGKLEVKSKVGEGSVFYFTLVLPLGTNTETEPEASTENLPEIADMGGRLLLVEDNEMNRDMTAELLRLQGFQVETAVHGKEAVEMYRSHVPGYYKGILMDIRMPVMDGLEATRSIRTLGKEDSGSIPIIAMTANAFDEDIKRSLDSGMNRHLTKPIDMKELLTTLREVFV